jgi:hypothetical protein
MLTNVRRSVGCAAMAAAVGMLFGCSSEGVEDPGPGPEDITPPTAPDPTTGGEDNTFDHDNSGAVDPFELLAQQEAEGPPEFSARLHSCPKIRYATIGSLLTGRGVDLATTGETQAGNIYSTSDQALGVANYGARIAETTELTTASAAKLFDIFVAAAPEIIANMPSRPECMIGGVGARMFNDYNQCTPDGVSCLIGLPATPAHMELCNRTVTEASTPEMGKIIAVAALAAAAHTCE